ncbi:MAG: phosphate ABC transporter substrate-binding protein [Deltaproteobacteria bacterium]|nr:phosphate ABC transporter substrate-binding protein [Deltaproteobacteria bacterium]
MNDKSRVKQSVTQRHVVGRSVLVMYLLAVLCATAASSTLAADNLLAIKGSTTLLPIIQSTSEVYMDRNHSVDISVQGGGSGVGIASLIDGTCDIAASSRPVKEKEIRGAKEDGVELVGTTVALDGIAVIVHPSNSLDTLTKAQIRDIYNGKYSAWSQLGGTAGKIVIVSRDTASGTFEAFTNMILGGMRMRPDALMQTSNKTVAMIVSRTPGAVGYIGIGYLSEEVKALVLDGVYPSRDTVLSGKYSLTRPLYLFTNGQPQEEEKRYIEFLLSEEGQKLVEETGFLRVR